MSLRENAKRTLQLIEAGCYTTESGLAVDFRARQAKAVDGTRLYTPSQLAALEGTDTRGDPVIDVVNGTTQVIAGRLVGEGCDDLVLLNFASARNPGGGFLNGAKAQEEDVCRCGGLYPALLTQWAYYEVNRAQKSLLYTDHMIYSPGVPFFKTRGTGDLLDAPFFASVITAPAPNAGAIKVNQPHLSAQIPATFARRWAQVLDIARDQGHRTLLLGAWGCGAFQNDPQMVAEAFKQAMQTRGADFDRVVFAIPGKGKRSRANLEVFERVLGAPGG